MFHTSRRSLFTLHSLHFSLRSLKLSPLDICHVKQRRSVRWSGRVLDRSSSVSAQQDHACIAGLKSDGDLLEEVKALSKHLELFQAKVCVELNHPICHSLDEPVRSARGKTVRLKAEGVYQCTFVALTLLVVGLVGDCAELLTSGKVRRASRADNRDVKGHGAGAREVVADEVTRAAVGSGNEVGRLVLNHDTSGVDCGS